MTWRWVPELRTLQGYHDEPAYVRALAASVRELWSKEGEPELLLTSYHGIPRRYFLGGDPYHCQCHKTSRLLAQELSLPADRYQVTFQSRLGREEWLTPYTDIRLEELARAGVRSVDVICPGFSVDCLETLDEIGREARDLFLAAGGGRFRFIPCLNDRPDQIDLYVELIRRNLAGWVESKGEWSEERAQAATAQTKALAGAMMEETGA
jgi:ferrochelatase